MPSFWKIQFDHWLNSPWGSVLFCPAGNPYQEISTQSYTRTESINCAGSEDRPAVVLTNRWWSVTKLCPYPPWITCLYLHTIIFTNFCEATIPCLLKSRQRFENYFYLTIFKLCASYQPICQNRKNCVIFISLVTCKYDMISCSVSFIT